MVSQPWARPFDLHTKMRSPSKLWVPPHDNGAPIRGYRVERAKAFRKNNRAPIAEEANWTQVRALKHDERDITDVPRRITGCTGTACATTRWASRTRASPQKIDLTDEATRLPEPASRC